MKQEEKVAQERRGRRRRRWTKVGLFLGWTLVVCYPNPLTFFRNFARYARFPVDPSILAEIQAPVPEDPPQIERFVEQWIPYQLDWLNYGVPWYVPTPREVLETGSGDCESQAVVLASLFEARGIPYRLEASLSHIWVDYPGRPENRSENDQIAYLRRENGRFRLQWPKFWDLWRQARVQRRCLWDPMPWRRKLLLLGGWGTILLEPLWRRLRGQRLAEGGPATETQGHGEEG